MDHQNDIPLFFIIGRPRSGTTLLRMLFESNPNVIIPPESPVILNLYKKYQKLNNWKEKDIRDLVNDLYEQRYFDVWLMDREELTEKLLKCTGKNSFKSIIKILYLNYPSLFPKQDIRLIGDKNPGYSLYIKKLYKLFPESKFIYINRDYRDNYLSLIKVNFEVPVVPLVVFRWKFAYKQFLKLQEKHPENFYYLRYEDLANDPVNNFKGVCSFLNIDFDPDVFDFHKRKDELEKAYAYDPSLLQVHQSLLKPINQSRIGTWKTKMTEKEIRSADQVAGKYAELAGYEKKYKKSSFWLKIKLAPLLFYARTIYGMMIWGEKLPYSIRNFLLEILGVFVKVYWSFNRKKIRDT